MSDTSHDQTRRDLRKVIGVLKRIRVQARALLVIRRAALILTLLVVAALLLGLTDYALRLPRALRIVHWFLSLIILGFLAWRYLLPALRFCPKLTDLALRIEERVPRLEGYLASAVDFAENGDGTREDRDGISGGLVQGVLNKTRELWPQLSVKQVLDRGGVIQATSFLILAVAAGGILFALSSSMWSIGAQRQVWPFGDASWPKRTGVADVTPIQVHPLGTALPLQAEVTRHNRPLADMNVAVRYRFIGDDEKTQTRRELLTWQGRNASDEVDGRSALFERLVETAGEAIEYRFETDDDFTEWKRITLVEPPGVLSASATLTPPEYAMSASESDQLAWTRPEEVELGPGADERAIAPAVLAGTRVDLTVNLIKPIDVPTQTRLAILDVDPDANFTTNGETWAISWTLHESARVPIQLVDGYGIEAVDDALYRFEAVKDRAAEATMTRPVTDQSVLPTAVVQLTAEGRDDVGLDWIGIERIISRPAEVAPGSEPSGPGGALEPVGEPEIIVREEASGERQLAVEFAIDLSVLGLKPGDQVAVTALASDISRGQTLRESRSASRTLRIISEDEFIEDIQRLFNDVRQSAIRIERQQAETQQNTRVRGAVREARRGQSQVTTRLDRQREALEEIGNRIRQNGLSDPEIEDMLESAQASLERAGESSASASRRMDEAASASRDDRSGDRDVAPETGEASASETEQEEQAAANNGEQGTSSTGGDSGDQSESGSQQGTAGESENAEESSPEEQEEVEAEAEVEVPGERVGMEPDEAQATEQEQQDVRDELLDLVEMLDRGEDSFVVRRKLENLAAAQGELREQTAQAAAQTTGRSASELTPREKSEMERIVERQQELAQQMQDLVEEMQTREEELREADPAAAAGMAQAAARAQQQQTGETMEQAAAEAAENQMTNAGQRQEEAMRDLEQMMEDIEAGNRQRDEILQRMLASIIDSIKGLIDVQKNEIAALDDARRNGDYDGRDGAMIELSQNTLGVIDLIDAGGPELAAVSANVDRAYDAQVRAITALRRDFIDEDAVLTHEQGSLEMLERALEQAEDIQEQMQNEELEKRKAELKRAYRDLLEQQVILINETEPFSKLENLSRRDRVQVRKLSDRQDGIRVALEELRASTEEIQAAKIFDYAHSRADTLMSRATVSLSEAEPIRAIDQERLAARVLQSIIESLEDPEQEEDPFDEGGGDSGGSGGGGQGEEELIPPMKELMLLKAMQITLSDATIQLENDGETDQAIIEELGEGQQQLFELAEELFERLTNPEPEGLPEGFDLDDAGQPEGETDSGSDGADDASIIEEVPN